MPARAMQTEDALNELLRVVLTDREGGRTRSRTEYQALFPGFESEIELELQSLAGGPCTENTRFGPYELIEELGRGAQGRVFRAHDTRLGRIVALKTMNAVAGLSAAGRTRFGREAEIVSRLEHPGICTVYEAGEHEGVPFIAMRFLAGETLARVLARDRNPPATPAELERVFGWIEEAARAVHLAHTAGIVHRDIKPGNLMITADGHAVLLDFGVAYEVEAHTLTLSGGLFGTPAYMAPEQIAGSARLLDHQVDVHALGVTLFECLTRELPFQGANRETLFRAILTRPATDPRRLNPALPRDARAVVEKALEKDPRRRYATALELAEELARLRRGEPVRARAITRPERLLRWARREPVRAGLISAALLAAGLGTYLGLRWDEIQAAEQQARVTDRQAWIDRGFEELRQGELERAKTLFRDALEIPPSDPEAVAGLLLCTRDAGLLEQYADVFASYPSLEWIVMTACDMDVYDPRIRALYDRIQESRSPLAVFIEGLGRLQGFDIGLSNTGRMGEFLVHTLIESKEARQLLRYRNEFDAYRPDDTPVADPARHLIRVVEAPEGDRTMSLAAAGDVDGDGWGDVLVAYVRGSESKTEFVQVVSGRTGGVLRTHALAPVPDPQPIEASMYDPWLERQAFVSTAPDMDGDGFAEHLLCWSNHWDAVLRRSGRIEVRSGRSGTLLHELAGDESTYWGSAPLTIDLDRDGLPELCTNGAHPAAPIGRVELHSLASGRRLFALEGSGTEGFGLSAALIGDVDGDTAPDLLVGSYKLSARGWASGGCLLYSVWDPEREEPRSPPVLIRRYPAAAHQERFGSVVLPLGDVDGDGTPDFCASGWYASAGSFHNGIVRAVSGADGRELWLARGDTPLADFGRSAAVLDDVDGDGTPEVVVGARRSSAGGREFCGSFSVLSGATGRTLLKIDGAGIWDGLGSSVASAGDVNGDGRADVLVSEHFPGDGQDVGNRPEREILERVYVYSVVPLR